MPTTTVRSRALAFYIHRATKRAQVLEELPEVRTPPETLFPLLLTARQSQGFDLYALAHIKIFLPRRFLRPRQQSTQSAFHRIGVYSHISYRYYIHLRRLFHIASSRSFC